MVVQKKQATPQTSALKKELQTPKKVEKEKKLVESEEDDDDDDDDDDELDDDELEDMDDDDDEDDEDDDDDDDDEEEDDDDDDSEDDDEEEEGSGISKGPTLSKSKQTPQKGKTPQKDLKGGPPKGPPKMQTPKMEKQTPGPKTGISMTKTPVAKIPFKNEKPGKQFSTNQTPSLVTTSAKPVVENAKKRKQEDSENPNSFKKAKISDMTPENLELEKKRIRERDRRTLFVRQLPSTVTEDEIRSWSPDIVDVRIPNKGRKKQKPQVYGFLEFISEKKAEENYSLLQNKKVNGIEIYVDYAGEKSEKFQKEGTPILPIRPVNKEMLYVTGIPAGTTMEDLGKLFPNAIEISMPKGPKSIVNRSAHLKFPTEAEAAEAFGRGGSLKIKGHTITILYAFAKSRYRKKKPKRKSKKKQSPKKSYMPQLSSGPFVKKEEESSDDNEDSDDDESD